MKTKHLFLSFVFTCSMLSLSFGQDRSTNPIESHRLKGMGLVSDLSFIKNVAEAVIRPIVARDSAGNPFKREDAVVMKHYLLVKIQTDQILNQLVADLTLKSKIGVYRKLDKIFKDDYDLADRSSKNKNRMLARYTRSLNELFRSESFKALILSPEKILVMQSPAQREQLESLRKELSILQLASELVDQKGSKIYDSLSTQSDILESSEYLKGIDPKNVTEKELRLRIKAAEQEIAEAEAAAGIEDFNIFDILYGGIEQGLAIEAAIREAQKAKVDGIIVLLDKLHLAEPATFKPKKE